MAVYQVNGVMFLTLDDRSLDALPVAAYLCDATGVIQQYNRRAADLWGRRPQAGDSTERFCGAYKLYRPDGTFLAHYHCPMGEALRTGRPRRDEEVVIERPDGSRVSVLFNVDLIRDESGLLLGAVNVLQDRTQVEGETQVAERNRLEQQFRQAQKMEAVGRLAGGVAHDFNNMLTVINGYSEVVFRKLRPDDPIREMVSEVRRAGERAAALSRQLLTFSRQEVLAPEVLDLNAVVRELGKLLRRVIGEDIDLCTNLQSNVGSVKADPGQIEQVVINLAVNARDAMPRGGKITLVTRNVYLDESYCWRHVQVRPGPYVLLAVSDTGHGMTEEVKARLFEPFFTTKEPGKGTGLGLAMAFGVIKQSGGHIEVYSEPGLGTTFKIYLPRVEGSAAGGKSWHGLSPAPRGNETLLVAEDEDGVRSFSRAALQEAGYTVLEASDGADALRVVGQHDGPIHLLVSDVVMPQLGGRDLAERLLQLHPDMKVLFLSGYTDDAVVRNGVLQEKVNFLQKPFSPLVLAHKVREILDSAAG